MSVDQSTDADAPGRARRLVLALADAMPGCRVALAGGLAWGLVMALCAGLGLAARGWADMSAIAFVAAFFLGGGFLAWAPALALAALLPVGRREARFAAVFLALACLTIAATAFLFAMQYRLYYAAWHDGPFTIRWIFQFVFTFLAAVYQFLVLGVRLFLPLGLLALAAASVWHARRPCVAQTRLND